VSNNGSDKVSANEMTETNTYAGYVGLIGRPNMGKSTWLNALVGERVSIISAKPQTTRHVVTGIYTEDSYQAVFVDTPGLHINTKNALSRMMNRSAQQSLAFVDVALFLVEAGRWTEEDDKALERLANFDGPVMLIINKIDRIKNKERLLPYIQSCQEKYDFADIYPVSAMKLADQERLRKAVLKKLPENSFFYADDDITTASMRFLVAEQLREQLFQRLNKEIPYSLSVACEKFLEEPNVIRINLVVWVERDSQKAIVIGKGGQTLKLAASQARRQAEQIVGKKIFLETWVRVRSGWADDEQALKAFGYGDDDNSSSTI
jgi:GTP-binding protein Era